MDIDFSLVLVVLVAICGFIWLLDRFLLAPGRRTAGDGAQEPVVVEYAKSFLPVLAIVLLLRSFLVEPFQIPSGSMIPTLEVGDFILVNKYHYGLRLPVVGTKIMENNEPARGDVMVFIPPHENQYFIKRVIGLPGDTIEYVDKVLRINGEPVTIDVVGDVAVETSSGMREGTLFNETISDVTHRSQIINRGSRAGRNSWVVPAGHYFMMGDNRDNSADSRVWGPVPESNIVGKAFAVWMHKEPGLNLPSFSRNQFIQ